MESFEKTQPLHSNLPAQNLSQELSSITLIALALRHGRVRTDLPRPRRAAAEQPGSCFPPGASKAGDSAGLCSERSTGSLEIQGMGAVLLRALPYSFSPAKEELGWPGGGCSIFSSDQQRQHKNSRRFGGFGRGPRARQRPLRCFPCCQRYPLLRSTPHRGQTAGRKGAAEGPLLVQFVSLLE